MLNLFRWAFPFSFSIVEDSAAVAEAVASIEGDAEGDEEVRSTDEGDKGDKKEEKAPEDPEFEIPGYEGKVKLSQIKEWQSKSDDYSTKLNDLTEQQKGVKELVQLSNYLTKNPKKLDKVLAILESPEEAVAGEAGKDKGAVKAAGDLTEIMEKLGSDDPAAVALKKLMGMVQGLQKDVGYFRDKETATTQQEAVAGIRESLNKTLEAEAKTHGFDKEEAEIWRQLTLSTLRNNPQEFEDEAQFQAAIKNAAKRSATAVKKIIDKTKSQYIKSKSGTPRIEGGEGSKGTNTPSMDNLEEVLTEQLEAANKEE